MNIEKFTIKDKEATLYHAKEAGMPLIVFNEFDGDGKQVIEAAGKLIAQTEGNSDIAFADEAVWMGKECRKDFNFLCVSKIDWNHDMSPWHFPALFAGEPDFTGGADEYLKLLVEEILPEALKRISGTPAYIGIAGYSLAGLFAIYALYQTDVFSRAASMSGSLWFPEFKEYVFSHEMKRKPEKLYFSLGDKEAKTRNRYMKTVQENTESIVEYYRAAGIDVTWEMNPGNHFKDAELRSARGVLGIV